MKANLPTSSYGAPRHGPSWFEKLASTTANISGKSGTFLLAAFVVVIWGVTGPIFQYSDTWQLVINTGTTIVTFLMVFLIQHTQNRDTIALQLKLDELILTTRSASDKMACIEEASDEELAEVKEEVRLRSNHKT